MKKIVERVFEVYTLTELLFAHISLEFCPDFECFTVLFRRTSDKNFFSLCNVVCTCMKSCNEDCAREINYLT